MTSRPESERSIYSLRHTAICTPWASGGGGNIYSLAKNAGTSVNQIERFYAKRLPISKELMENLQLFRTVRLRLSFGAARLRPGDFA